MPVILNNKLAGTINDGTNSYVDQAYADAYFGNHWDANKVATWNALTSSQKPQLLVAACRTIETARFTHAILRTDWRFHRYYNRLTMQVMNFQLLREPVRWYFYQVLQFPRNLDINPVTGALFIPEAIQMAQCEQAVWMVGLDKTALQNRIQGVTNDTVSVGRNQVHVSQQYGYEGSEFSPDAYEMIKPYLVRSAKMRRA